jgi:small subunit ribosomal protein S4
MARYIGPTCRLSRRYEMDLDFKIRDIKSKCNLALPPGQHGSRKKRVSDYGLQLAAKQQLRYKYGLLEKQFHRLYVEAARRTGSTGVILMQLLESRLDNVVYRMGFASTRREARQLVGHKGIVVNGHVVSIPSYQVKVGDEVSVREAAKEQTRVKEAIQRCNERERPDWVHVDATTLVGIYKRVPDRIDLPSDTNEQLVVELYSK